MTQPVQPRPQPVVREFNIQGAVSGLIVAIGEIAFIVRDGITVDNLFTLGNLVATVISIGLGAYVWYSARVHGQVAAAQVTPLESPVTYGGQQLLTADQWVNHYGKHAKQPEAPAVQQEWDEKSLAELKAPRPTPYPRELPAVTEPAPVVTLEPEPTPVVEPEPVVEPRVPANMVVWAQHVLTLKGQSKANIAVAQEILGLSGQ